MTLDPAAAWHALATRDARFDGRFFVGVTSTGIYCRPVCRVRVPRPENCRFFDSAARAEHAGFRPCLRCRPEQAPGWSRQDACATLAAQAEALLTERAHDGGHATVAGVAQRLGISERHLHRIFVAAHGVTPIQHLTTRRLLLAKRLLTDTDRPVGEIALAAGFGSLRRFHAAFLERYRLNPGQLRAGRAASARTTSSDADALRFTLPWRAPYDVDGQLGFLTRRALPGVEAFEGRRLRRTFAIGRHAGWVEAAFDDAAQAVQLAVAPALLPVTGAVLARARLALDLDADPQAIAAALADLPGGSRPGVRLAAGWDGFEAAVRVVLGQQVSVARATQLAGRFAAAFGAPVATPWPDVDRRFPSAAEIAQRTAEDLQQIGLIRQRAVALQALATAIAEGRLDLSPATPPDTAITQLGALPGIGPWSAQLIALRALGWPDAWCVGDLGLKHALAAASPDTAVEALRDTARWRPWRSYAVMALWLQSTAEALPARGTTE